MTVQPLADTCGLANAHARAQAEGQSLWRNEERLAACILDLGGPKPLDRADDAGRQTHLSGPIASALMANAAELLARAPQIEQVDVLAVKLPK